MYAVRVQGGIGRRAGAANIGPNPTFGVTARKVEVHLLEFAGDLYGQPISLDFVARLRDTKAFESKEQLIAQLIDDVEHAKNVLTETRA